MSHINKQKHSLGYKPEITYVDEYDSTATLSSQEKQITVNPTIKDPTPNTQENFDRIDIFLNGLNDDIRELIEGVYLPTKDFWEEIKDDPYGTIPKKEELTIVDPENNIEDEEDDEDDDEKDYTQEEEDDDLPPADVLDDDKLDGIIHIIKEEHEKHEIVEKEYIKNTKDLLDFYTEGLLNAISNYWVQTAPIISGASSEKKSYILNDFKSYKAEDSSDISSQKRHMLDFAVRTEIVRQNKISFLKKMFPTDETMTKLRNFKAAYELRKKYAKVSDMTGETKEASDYNALLKSSTYIYDKKYDSSYAALYKYYNSSNKTLADIMNLSVQEQKAKQYLK